MCAVHVLVRVCVYQPGGTGRHSVNNTQVLSGLPVVVSLIGSQVAEWLGNWASIRRLLV